METVYLETTFISYLVARPSRDLLVAAHQQATHDWWANRRDQFRCVVSPVVVQEVSDGDPTEAAKRLEVIGPLAMLEITDDARALTNAILESGALPASVARDATHIAVATVMPLITC
jgi:hypothetical protein